ncbi:MAG TPA: hypothetical protein VI669_05025 [Vicinamibacteria bacterium]
MNKSLAIAPEVLKRLRGLAKQDKTECLLALCELADSFGRPHVHGGLGIRKLGERLFECRGTISLRFLFQDRRGELFVSFLGNHDEVKTLLRRGTYR